MKSEQTKALSLGYFNMARGLGMLLIVLGHSVNLYLASSEPGGSGLFLGSGSVLGGGIMAAFFMISGFGFYKRSPKKCFSIQRRLLLRPYFWVAAAVLTTKLLLAVVKQRSFLENGGELVLTYLLGLNAEGGGELFGIPVESVSIFWFVLALFGGWILYNGISRFHSQRLKYFCVAGCVVLSYIMTLLWKIWPYCLPMAFLAAGYLWAGEAIKNHGLLEGKLPWTWWVLIAVVAGITAAFGGVNIVACVWKLGLLDVAGSFCWGFLLLRLYALFMRKEHKGKFFGALEEIGFQSIWIVCLHAYEKVIFPWYRIPGILPDHPWIGVGLCFIGRCVIMYVLYKMILCIIKKTKKKKSGKIVLER